MSRYKEYLEYYKRKLERHMNDENTVQYVIDKLNKTEFPASELLNTGIYKVVRAMSKSAGQFTDRALPLYNKWKLLILAEEHEQQHLKPAPPAQSNIPAPIRVIKTPENYVSDPSKMFPPLHHVLEGKNGYEIVVENPLLFPDIDSATTKPPPCNPSPVNDVGPKSKSSIPVQLSVNTFQPFSNFSDSSQPVLVHNVNSNVNVKVNESCSIKQNSVSDFSANFDSQSNLSNAFSSPHSSSSQNPLDIGTATTASPSKIGRIPDPYTIEMREGMFRVVKSREGLTPEIIRVRRLYNQEDENYESENDEGKATKDKQKSPIKSEHLPKNDKSSKVGSGDKNAEKTINSKPKNHTPDRGNNNNNRVEKSSVKSGKVKSVSSSDKSAIEKSKSDRKVREGHHEELKSEKNFNKKISKANNKGSPIKTSAKDSPLVKSSTKGSPSVKINTKGSPSVKSSSKGSPSVKSNSKGSPSISVNHSSPCDIKKVNPGHRDCDKKASKVLSNDAAESFISSKKERTSIYSGKKTLQDVPSLLTCCVRMLQKNIEYIKYTKHVPYEQLKPVLTQCSPNQLRRLEEFNPYLMQGTEEIWKAFCQRKYRDIKPSYPGTWRDLYWKAREDQDRKLKSLTATISASRQRAAPERKMMLTESPERPRSKKMRLSAPEPREVAVKIPSKEHAHNSFKESSTTSHKAPPKEAIHPKPPTKETNSSSHKKAKKAPVAPLMSKVKKTISFFAMHKK